MWFVYKWGWRGCFTLKHFIRRENVCERIKNEAALQFIFFLLGRGGVKRKKASKTQIITMPTTSDTTRAEPKNFLIHLNVKATFAALPPCESPQAAKRPVVSHLFTPAAAGCHWDSEGEIPWFSLPFLTAPAQTTLIRDCGRARG